MHRSLRFALWWWLPSGSEDGCQSRWPPSGSSRGRGQHRGRVQVKGQLGCSEVIGGLALQHQPAGVASQCTTCFSSTRMLVAGGVHCLQKIKHGAMCVAGRLCCSR